jgi:glycosyltransferase involved in cell wall biosynthesis
MIASLKHAAAMRYLDLSLSHVKRRLSHHAKRSFDKVFVVAELKRNTGIVRGARLQHQFLRQLGINAELLDATGGARNPFHRVIHEKGSAYIFHSGGPQIATLMRSVLPLAGEAYRIAYWAWELPTPPRDWPSVHGLVSEIWTCSSYSQRSLQGAYDIPVISVPHVLPQTKGEGPKTLGGTFEVLAFADTRSSLQRKNPAAAIQAFRKAFGNSSRAQLTLKLSGNPADYAAIVNMAAQAPNIRVIAGHLSEDALDSLFRSSNVLLSLHRAEGFGLPMLEAMSRGVPVIATNWSGNLDYMDERNSLLVPCSMVEIGDDTVYGAYSDTCWAEPDVDCAAHQLLTLASDEVLYHRLSSNAQQSASDFSARQGPGNFLRLSDSRVDSMVC